jgi:hypothetical protein
MEKQNESLRDILLARLPQPENLTAFREEVAAGLAKREKRLSWEKWLARALWIYVLGFGLVCFYRGEKWLVTPNGHKLEFASLILFIVGVMQLLKYFTLLSRVEILKEVKQVQLQVLELQASIQKNGGR